MLETLDNGAPLTTLEEERHAELADRRATLLEQGASSFTVLASEEEIHRKFALASGMSLPPALYERALDEDTCRREGNGKPHACERLIQYGQTCSDSCPVAKQRADRLTEQQRMNTAAILERDSFATDWGGIQVITAAIEAANRR